METIEYTGDPLPHITTATVMDTMRFNGTLRDWFAGQALVGLLFGVDNPKFEILAYMAYQQADAMLKARAE